MPNVKSAFLEFVRHIVNGEIDEVSRGLAASPTLATAPAEVGAARHAAPDFFFTEIAHYLYAGAVRSEEHTSELQSHSDLVCRLLLEKKKTNTRPSYNAMTLSCIDP